MSLDNSSDDLLGSDDSAGFFGDEDEGPDLFAEETPKSKPSARAADEPVAPTANLPAAKAQSDGYVVLARKYRPQTFDDIVGQQAVQQGLRGAIATGQISHAYLFSGPRGTGKTSTARILAKALNCMDNGPRPDPCGRCASCRSITAGSSLDVIEIDAASNTGVDNIRELKSGVVLAPFSRYKVYIVDEVHMLSNQAFNALLKTLEEPPAQVIFVLATTELHKVPETIISRCQTFMFRRFSLDELKSQLGNILDIELKQRGLSVEPDDRARILDLVSRNAEGGMRDAQVTLDQVLVLSKGKLDFESVRRFLGMADVEALGAFVQNLHGRLGRELLELIDTLVSEGQDLELFVKGVCEYLRDLLLVKTAGKDTSLINVSEDRALELETTAKALSADFMIRSIEHFLKVIGEMKSSGQPRTVLELAVLKLTLTSGPGGGGDLSDIERRLEALEKVGGRTAVASAPQAAAVPKAERSPEAETSKVSEVMASAEPASKAPSAALQAHVSEPAIADGDIVGLLIDRLRAENGLLALSLERAVCGHDRRDNVLTIILNSAQKFDVTVVQRPQNAAAIVNAARSLFGADLLVRIEEREGPAARVVQMPENRQIAPEPIASSGSTSTARVMAEMESSPSYANTYEEASDPVIYYPEEIREKAMVEIDRRDFENLLATDGNLKTLVDKTLQVFGIDSSRLKYHRSTLA